MLSCESTLLGFHKPPGSLADGALALGPRDAQPLAAVDVGVKSGAFHFAYINIKDEYTKSADIPNPTRRRSPPQRAGAILVAPRLALECLVLFHYIYRW